MHPALEKGHDSHEIGKDPREMTIDELNALGHTQTPLRKVIRAHCLECCNGEIAEVRKCTAHACQLWPYRMNKNPFIKKEISEEQKEAIRARFQNRAAE